MIIARYTHKEQETDYLVQVHTMDGETFATVYKNDEFYHYTSWTSEEQEFINGYIDQAMNVPQFPQVIYIRGDK